MSDMSVAEALDRAITRHGKPRTITVEHGTGFTIRPGKPTENGPIDAFNGKLRDECLNVHPLLSIEDARSKTEAWRVDYKLHRPHSSLGHLTPREHLKRSGREDQEAAFFSVQMDLRRDPRHLSKNFTPAWS